MPGNEFDLTERERIRWALIDYMKAHKIGVPTLADRIKKSHPREMEIPWKTLQRFLAGIRTRDMALKICAAFVEKLPNKPTAMHALGEAMYAVYGKTSHGILAGTYLVSTPDGEISELIMTDPDAAQTAAGQKFLFAKESASSTYRRIYDGILVFSGSAFLIILKDRLLRTARVHALYIRPAPDDDFHGVVFDSDYMESRDLPTDQGRQISVRKVDAN